MGFFNTPTVISADPGAARSRRSRVTSLTRSPLLPRRADAGRARRQGLRGQHLVRLRRAGRNAAEIVAAPERDDRQDSRACRRCREKLAAQGFELAPPQPPAAFMKVIHDDMEKWLPIVKASGAKVD